MIDIQRIRNDIPAYKTICAQKRKNIDIDRLIQLDDKRKELQLQIDQTKHKQKELAATQDYEAAKQLKTQIQEVQSQYDATIAELNTILLDCPNFISPDTPIGETENDNIIIRNYGKPKNFDFIPLDHEEIGKKLGIIDKEKAAQVTGARFAYLKGDIVLLQNAIAAFTFDTITNTETLQKIINQNNIDTVAKPFVPVIPPLMINFDTAEKMGRLRPMDDRFTFWDDRLMMIGSAEHSLGPIHMDETIPAEQLPLRYVANTPAFRREAGTYGKDTKGILRMHQFDKIEMETFSLPEHGLAEQDLIVAIQEYLIKQLDLPYEVMAVCTGDMGNLDYRQIDINIHIPSQWKYRETHTSDYMTDYQARRLNIKYQKEDGTRDYVHMNDATAFALGRIMIAIIENYQTADGKVQIPTILQPYMHGKTHIG
jgi:seryl-tRNA synthetase